MLKNDSEAPMQQGRSSTSDARRNAGNILQAEHEGGDVKKNAYCHGHTCNYNDQEQTQCRGVEVDLAPDISSGCCLTCNYRSDIKPKN